MHLDVIQVFTLAEIVVVRGGEQSRPIAPNHGLQEPVVDVERQRLESVHLLPLFGSENQAPDRPIDKHRTRGNGEREGKRESKKACSGLRASRDSGTEKPSLSQ